MIFADQVTHIIYRLPKQHVMYGQKSSYLYINIYTYTHTCISYIPGAGALPDIYARLPGGARRPRASAYISGKARGPGI